MSGESHSGHIFHVFVGVGSPTFAGVSRKRVQLSCDSLLSAYSNSPNYRQYPSVLNQPTQSRWLTHKSAQETVLGKSSAVRHFHLRKSAFIFDQSISIGFIIRQFLFRIALSLPTYCQYAAFGFGIGALPFPLFNPSANQDNRKYNDHNHGGNP